MSLMKNSLKLIETECCVCNRNNAEKIGAGADYEYRTSDDVFAAVRCASCGLVYLNPRPDVSELATIYPSNYHAFDFAEADYGIVYKIRSRLEANRLLLWC